MEFCQKLALLSKNAIGASTKSNEINANSNSNAINGRDELILELICPILFKLCERASKIFQQRAQQTLLVLVNSFDCSSFWPDKILECITSQSKSLRAISMDLFHKIIEKEFNNNNSNSNNIEESSTMERIITLGLSDASPQVRESSRNIFAIIDSKFPKMANGIYNNSNSVTQKLLRKPSVSISSFSNEESSLNCPEKKSFLLSFSKTNATINPTSSATGSNSNSSNPINISGNGESTSSLSTNLSCINNSAIKTPVSSINGIAAMSSTASNIGSEVMGTGMGTRSNNGNANGGGVGLIGASRVLKSSHSTSNLGSAVKGAQRVINTNASNSNTFNNLNTFSSSASLTSQRLFKSSASFDSMDNSKSSNNVPITSNSNINSTVATASSISSSFNSNIVNSSFPNSSLKDQFNSIISDSKNPSWNQRQKSFEELSMLLPSLLVIGNNNRTIIIKLLEALIVGLGDLHFKVLQTVISNFGLKIFQSIQMDLISPDLVELVIIRLEMILGNVQFKLKPQIIEGSQQLLFEIFKLLNPEKLLLILSGAMLKSDAATSFKLRSNLLGHVKNILLSNMNILSLLNFNPASSIGQELEQDDKIREKHENQMGISFFHTKLIFNRFISILNDTEVIKEILEIIEIIERLWPKTVQLWSDSCKVPQIKQLVMDHINKQKIIERSKLSTMNMESSLMNPSDNNDQDDERIEIINGNNEMEMTMKIEMENDDENKEKEDYKDKIENRDNSKLLLMMDYPLSKIESSIPCSPSLISSIPSFINEEKEKGELKEKSFLQESNKINNSNSNSLSEISNELIEKNEMEIKIESTTNANNDIIVNKENSAVMNEEVKYESLSCLIGKEDSMIVEENIELITNEEEKNHFNIENDGNHENEIFIPYEEETTEHRLLVKEIVSRLSGEMPFLSQLNTDSPSNIIESCEMEEGEIIEFDDHVPIERDNSEIFIRRNMKSISVTSKVPISLLNQTLKSSLSISSQSSPLPHPTLINDEKKRINDNIESIKNENEINENLKEIEMVDIQGNFYFYCNFL